MMEPKPWNMHQGGWNRMRGIWMKNICKNPKEDSYGIPDL